MCLRGLIAVAVFTLTGCAPVVTDKAQTEVIVSQTDARQYRYFELDNGLKALAISDPEATKSAAALSVAVGSYQEPKHREGLAHFLEHMLFLGTEKYPDSGEYSEYLDANGGHHNAYTAYDLTNYHFSVNSSAFPNALDRFAQFFISPLFTEELVEREKNAVNSEYSTRIGQDAIRRIEAMESEMNSEHPVWKFNAGNLSTLSDTEGSTVREDLLRFYENYYSSDRMSVAVLSSESLDELEQMVRTTFSAVPKKQNIPNTEFPSLFQPGELPKIIEVAPIKEQRTLSLTFPVPNYQANYTQKPLYYIASQVGYEGTGSLHDALKTRGWIEWLYAGSGMNYGAEDSFVVSIGLTPKGLEHQDEIIAAVLAQIKLSKNKGIEEWRFEEMSNLAESSFRFSEKEAAIQYVIGLANGLESYAPEDVVRGSSMLTEFSPKLIEQALSYLRADNMLVTLLAPGVEADQTTRFYDVKYRAYQPTPERQARWQNNQVNDLALAKRNPFVPESLEIKRFPNKVDKPLKLPNTGSVEVWHYPNPSNEFSVPKAQIHIALDRAEKPDAVQKAIEVMYFSLVNEQLNEERNYASQASVSFNVSAGDHGAVIKLGGFSDKLLTLADRVFRALPKPEFSDDQFERVRLTMQRSFRNYRLQTPYQRLGTDLRELMNADSLSRGSLVEALQKVTPEQVRKAPEKLFKGVRAQVMVAGNMTEQEARQLASDLYLKLELTDSKVPIQLGERVLKLSVSPQREISLQDIAHHDAAVLRYYQGRNNSRKERATFTLLGQMMHQPYFHQLRTEQQLGYVVGAYGINYDRVPGIALLVQSPTISAPDIELATDGFIDNFSETLRGMDDATFAGHRDALVVQLEEKAKNLAEKVQRKWSGLRAGFPEFDNRELFIAELASLTLADVRNAFQQAVVCAPRSLSVISAGKAGGVEATIVDAQSFRTGKAIYERE